MDTSKIICKCGHSAAQHDNGIGCRVEVDAIDCGPLCLCAISQTDIILAAIDKQAARIIALERQLVAAHEFVLCPTYENFERMMAALACDAAQFEDGAKLPVDNGGGA